jgi:serine/threonine-protein kinase
MSIDSLRAGLADRYRIERELGAGGMATVYLARDLKHNRAVAIKVLRPELAASLGAERFLREVATTAGLRHPHILPLYDSGEAAGFLFYVMPVVEGESLRDRLEREKQLPLDDAIRLTQEIAGALAYAQAHGVIHRDIKPENILLDSGHAVVADFGIAMAVNAAAGERLTHTGLALGTPQYMSPEQASGAKDLDGRSDIYSLACLLYEMLGGQPPFHGPTVENLVYQHLSVEPPPITNLRPSVPAPIGAALQRALAKAPADRFPTMAGFAEALSGARPSGAIPPRHRNVRLIAGIVLVGIAGLAAIWLTVRPRMAPGAALALELGRQMQVTHDPGLEIDPALSPDGKLLAFSGTDGVLFVRQVEGGDPLPVIRGGDGKGRWPAWSPSGDRVVFLSPRGVEMVPALGGSPHLIAPEAGTERGIALSPRGDSVAFVILDSLFVKPVDGAATRLVTTSHEVHSPAWSPDGRWIAFVSGNPQYVSIRDRSLGNAAASSVQVVPSAGGMPIQVTGDRTTNVSPAWTADGALLYVSDQDGSRDVYQAKLAKSGRPAGQPVRLTTGLNVHGIALARNGSRLAYSSFSETSNVWTVEIPPRGSVSISQARPLTTRNQIIENMDVSHDGRWLAYSSNVNGTTNHLYRVRLDQPQTEQQLTMDSVGAYWAAWSPDDREIAFHRFNGERRQIFVQPVEGGTTSAVTDGTEDDRSPEWSPDGHHLVFLANWATRGILRMVDRAADGRWSAPRAIPVVVGTDTIVPGLAVWSPDGQLLACGCGEGGLVIIPTAGGAARRLPSPYTTAGWAFPQWSADGRTIYHLTEDAATGLAVAAVPLNGSSPRIVARFDDPTRPWHRFGFRVRQDRMFLTLGHQESDIWVADIRGR